MAKEYYPQTKTDILQKSKYVWEGYLYGIEKCSTAIAALAGISTASVLDADFYSFRFRSDEARGMYLCMSWKHHVAL